MANDNVIPFPAMDGRPLLERGLRRELPKAGLSQRATDHVADGMAAFYETLDAGVPFRFDFDGSLVQHEAVATSVGVAFTEAFEVFKKTLWHERLNRELDLAARLGL